MEIKVAKVLHEIGIPAHIRGFYYMQEAITMAVNDESVICNITNRIYPAIATKYNTTPSNVGCAIRNAIKKAWTLDNIDEVCSFLGYTTPNYTGKPKNSQFIGLIAQKIRLGQTASDQIKNLHDVG